MQCAEKLGWEHLIERKANGTEQKDRVLSNGLYIAEVGGTTFFVYILAVCCNPNA